MIGKQLRKKFNDYYIERNLPDLFAEVKVDLPKINQFKADDYFDWFTSVYPMQNLLEATDTDPYVYFLQNFQSLGLEKSLEIWCEQILDALKIEK